MYKYWFTKNSSTILKPLSYTNQHQPSKAAKLYFLFCFYQPLQVLKANHYELCKVLNHFIYNTNTLYNSTLLRATKHQLHSHSSKQHSKGQAFSTPWFLHSNCPKQNISNKDVCLYETSITSLGPKHCRLKAMSAFFFLKMKIFCWSNVPRI